ncbi:MAG: hypothetical protein KF883_09280 [Thermomicrobiales bacterium]|nr:hypothetical protein [Thermomicrobiales bacterium]
MSPATDSRAFATSQAEVEVLALAAHGMSIGVAPELGGKIVSMVWDGREFLFQNQSRPLRRAEYGASYADFDASGFDECLPSIGACRYPDGPWKDADVPDHGELWSIPWRTRIEANAVHQSVDGIRLPYTFSRSIELLPGPQIQLRYELRSRSSHDFPFLWSAHPLLAIEDGSQIHVPEPVEVIVDWSLDERLGPQFARHQWPRTTDKRGGAVDMSLIGDLADGFVEKLYTSPLQAGWCGVHHPSDGYWVAMVFSTTEIPYVGLSINQGGWPVDGPGYFNLGLEPCNGFPDRLDIAHRQGTCRTLPPHGALSWEFSIFFGLDDDFPRDSVSSLAAEVMHA